MDSSNVSIVLDGVDRELVCTVEAALIMSKAYTGLMNLYHRIQDLDLEAFTVAIRAGLMVDGDEAVKLADTIFKTGMVNLQPQVAAYVLLTASGGVRVDNSEGDKPEKPGKPSA